MDSSTAPDVMSGLSADPPSNIRREQQPIAEHLGELTPISFTYINRDEVLVTLATATGDFFSYTLKAKMLATSVSLSMALINEYATTINLQF